MLVGSLVMAAATGWLLLQMVQPPSLQSATRAQLDQQVQDQLRRRRGETLPPEEERRLLERLIALGRYRDSIVLVQSQLERQPKAWRWRLLLSQLLRRSGDRRGADRELALLQRLHPDRMEILEATAWNDLNHGRSQASIERIKRLFEARPKTQRLTLGLLFADLYRQTGQVGEATATYRQLAHENPTDPRPLLALALLQQEQGQSASAQALLAQAQQRQSPEEALRRPLKGLAARWALETARASASAPAFKAGRMEEEKPEAPSDIP